MDFYETFLFTVSLIKNNYDWLISTVIQVITAFLVFYLSKKLSKRSKIEHKDRIKEKTERILAKIQSHQLKSKVYLININRYFKDYPENKEKLISGYSHIRADVKSTRFNGVEFFCSTVEQVYRKKNGSLTFTRDSNKEAFKAYPVGIIPYEWIEYVDEEGDEYGFIPLFYCKFKGTRYWKNSWKRFLPFGYPYKELIYYKESDNYQEGDPTGMKWRLVREPIANN